MADVADPGEIRTSPPYTVAFSGPFTEKRSAPIQIVNAGDKQIIWVIKHSANARRVSVEPQWGTLNSKETATVTVTSDKFAYGQEDLSNDRVIIDWVIYKKEIPHQNQFKPDGRVLRRKTMGIEYTP